MFLHLFVVPKGQRSRADPSGLSLISLRQFQQLQQLLMILRVGVLDGALAQGRCRGVPRAQGFDVGCGKGFDRPIECRQSIG